MGHFPVYQVFLRGPTKVEYLFLDRSQDPLPPLEPTRDTLPAINTHFWDWIWWLTTKASIGRSDLVAEHMPRLYTQLLRPMGISAVPATIESAVEAFVARRDALEQQFGIRTEHLRVRCGRELLAFSTPDRWRSSRTRLGAPRESTVERGAGPPTCAE